MGLLSAAAKLKAKEAAKAAAKKAAKKAAKAAASRVTDDSRRRSRKSLAYRAKISTT
jgi:hypothetical protein